MYKIYRDDNYIIVVNLSNQEIYTGFVKEVFVKRSNAAQPAFMFSNIKGFDPNLSLKIGLIYKEDSTPYTMEEFEEFYKKNTGNFNQGGDSPGVQSVTGDNVDNSDPQNPKLTVVMEAGETTFTLDGTTTVFDIPHTLGVVPRSFAVTFADAGNLNFVQSQRTRDASKIRFTCEDPPAIGTQTVYWQIYK